jgi:hypothetical protein
MWHASNSIIHGYSHSVGIVMKRMAMSQLVVETVLFFQEMPGNKALA